MSRAIVLVSGILALAGCAQDAWKADPSRYPTKAEQEAAFARYNEHCLLKSRVIVRNEQVAGSGHRIAHDTARFNDCMEAAGFRHVGRNTEQTPPDREEAATTSDEKPEAKGMAAAAPATQAPDPPAIRTAEPEVAPSPPPTAPPAETPPAALPAARTTPADGRYRVQLAAASSRAAALREWARLRQAWPEIFGARELIIVKKELAGRGTFYRVQTGGFDTLREARSMCTALHAKKQACFPVRTS